MKNKNITWERVYELPLEYDGYNYAWAKNGTMSLMFEFELKTEDCQRIVDIINGDRKGIIKGLFHDEHEFFIEDQYIFCVRGWGYLTGVGGLNLPPEKAAKIQDEFIQFILKKLTKNE